MYQFSTSRKLITNGSGHRAGAPGSGRGRRWARFPAAVAASAAVAGVLGLPGPAALAGAPPALTWTKQHPATSPSARIGASMVYDAANGTVVLFGSTSRRPDQTWTWDGSTWTRQSPASSPPAQAAASMAYDAATGTVVLFGGVGGPPGPPVWLRGTWTWSAS